MQLIISTVFQYLIVVSVFVSFSFGILTTPATTRSNRKQNCQSLKNGSLDKCLSKIPPLPDFGIPSNAEDLGKACLAFKAGMKCFDDSMDCLPQESVEKLKNSIKGAHETFDFLCLDPKFQHEYLKHSACYQSISSQWDKCAHRFIDTMKKLPLNEGNSNKICCAKIMYLRCTHEIALKRCGPEASKFLSKIAETLVRTSIYGNVGSSQQCAAFTNNSTYCVSILNEKSSNASKVQSIVDLPFTILLLILVIFKSNTHIICSTY